MLTPHTHGNGLVTFQSPLLRAAGVPHAFSTRRGGVSPAPFDTLNLGNPASCAAPDSSAHLDENYRRLGAAIDALYGTPAAPTCRAWASQVHGRHVELIEPEPENEYAESLAAAIADQYHGQRAADALVTRHPQVMLTIRVADCVPVLLASADGRQVAAVHCGWRGVVAGIVARALLVFAESQIPPERILAAIGPGIAGAAFEVGPEVAAEFSKANLPEALLISPNSKPHIDLQAAIHTQLSRAGVAQIDGNTLCTYRDRDLFFSHRRDHGMTGRMAALVRPASPAPK